MGFSCLDLASLTCQGPEDTGGGTGAAVTALLPILISHSLLQLQGKFRQTGTDLRAPPGFWVSRCSPWSHQVLVSCVTQGGGSLPQPRLQRGGVTVTAVQAAPEPHKAPVPEPDGGILYPGDRSGSGDRVNHDRHPAEPCAKCRMGDQRGGGQD